MHLIFVSYIYEFLAILYSVTQLQSFTLILFFIQFKNAFFLVEIIEEINLINDLKL